ncbi:MAG: flagellar hook-basal body protein [Spirochaetales bacterium]|nr:flagellar hook-basal body protein [Spirochaetales bacterium]
MIRGLYTGASGMMAQMHRMDALSHNLANVDVTGYKKDTSVSKAFPEMLIRRMSDDGLYKFPFGSMDTAPIVGTLGTGVEYNETFTIFSQGALKQTENPFDMALSGKGFFTVSVDGRDRYTRNGTFLLNDEGTLVTKDGHPVLGLKGEIQIKKNNFVIDEKGNVYQNAEFADDPQRLVSMMENEWKDLELIDTLKVSDFNRDRYLKKEGNSFWKSTFESGEAYQIQLGSETKIIQGFLEGSNVNPVTEMVKMIEINRAYEANQKVIQSQDSLTGRLFNDILRA